MINSYKKKGKLYILNAVVKLVKKILRKSFFIYKALKSSRYLTYDCFMAESILNRASPDVHSSCQIERETCFEQRSAGGVCLALSVVVPVYNRENYIKQCIDSILNQKTDLAFEVVVVDDGSTDKTGGILDSYSDGRLNIIHQDNKGFSGARNVGISESKGNYIMFVDSDDKLLPGAIDNLMFCALNTHADVVQGSYMKRFSDGTIKCGARYENQCVNPKKSMEGFFWGKVYKHDVFDTVQLPEGYWYEDSLNAQIMWDLCAKAFTISDFVYEYYINSTGISATSVNNPKAIDSFYITRQLIKDRIEYGLILGQDEYEYFLRMVVLTYFRTRCLEESVRQSVFLGWCDLKKQYYEGFRTISDDRRILKIEISLSLHAYRLYVINCEMTRKS